MTTQNMLIGGALIVSLAAATLSVMVWKDVDLMGPGDDQPVVMVGGSLNLRSLTLTGWDYVTGGGPPYYRYQSTFPIRMVEWMCGLDDVHSPARPNGAMEIVVTYGSHKVKFHTPAQNAPLEIRMTNLNDQPIGPGYLRHLVEVGEHPNRSWEVESMTSTNLDPQVTCPENPDPKYLLLKIHACRNADCS